jgi:hypothetical protein
VNASMVAERRRYTKTQQRAYRRRLRDRESMRLWGTKDVYRIDTPEQAAQLPVGTWVYDRHGVPWCWVDTSVAWPQRMFARNGMGTCVSHDYIDYPLAEAELTEDCPHAWGTQECGHCKSCGQLVGEPKVRQWHVTVIDGPERAA